MQALVAEWSSVYATSDDRLAVVRVITDPGILRFVVDAMTKGLK